MSEKINLWKWASETLSAPRKRAFDNALRHIEDNKFSKELWAARKEAEALVQAHTVAIHDEVVAIEKQTNARMDVIREQIKDLQNEMEEIRVAGHEKVLNIRCEIYKNDEYIAADAKARALFERDDAAAEPLRQALVAKYSQAQEKANA